MHTLSSQQVYCTQLTDMSIMPVGFCYHFFIYFALSPRAMISPASHSLNRANPGQVLKGKICKGKLRSTGSGSVLIAGILVPVLVA